MLGLMTAVNMLLVDILGVDLKRRAGVILKRV